MTRRSERKQRAQTRNIQRHAANLAAGGADPEIAEAATRAAHGGRSAATDSPAPSRALLSELRAAERQTELAKAQRAAAADLAKACEAEGIEGKNARRRRKEHQYRAKAHENQARLCQISADRKWANEVAAHHARQDQEAVALQARRRGETLDAGRTAVVAFARNPETGELICDAEGIAVPIVTTATVMMRPVASVRARLARLAGITEAHIRTALRLESDWYACHFEARITVDPEASGGGRVAREDMAALLAGHPGLSRHAQARERWAATMAAVRPAGEEVVSVLENVIINGARLADSGHPVYGSSVAQSAHVASILIVGLTILGAHYGAADAARKAERVNA